MIYSPKDLGCWWDSNYSKAGDGKLAFELGANIVAYATGLKPPQPRLTKVEIARDVKDEPRKRGYLQIAQFDIDKPAPRAARNLLMHLHNYANIDVVPKVKNVSFTSRSLSDYRLLYLHGRKEFKVSKRGLEKLRFNLTHGGLLFADACCGSEKFDKSFRKFAKELFPDAPLERVPVTDFLYSSELNGKAIDTIRCRRKRAGQMLSMPPELEGIKANDRWVLLYSKYDIGCALEKHQASDCRGYDPESALRLATAAVLYALRP